jgi:heme/copper-type cytochrome/quinol oxidase subunit 3
MARFFSRSEEEVEPSEEAPEIYERNLWIGARVMAGTTIMFFAAFVFAYFYLRSLNNTNAWHPDGVDAPQAWGAVIVALFVASAGLFTIAARTASRGRSWLIPAGLSLTLGVVGCIVQVFEWAHLDFGPQNGGYASVFIGWTALFVVFVLICMFWIEMLFAEGFRKRNNAATFVPVGIADAAFYWSVLASLGVISWVILYLL